MSKFDENLFSRIALLNNYVSKRQLDECLEIRSGCASKEHIGNLLLERGYLTRDQFNRIVEIRNRKVRKLLRSQEDSLESDREFGRLVLQERLIDLDGLEEAVLEQKRLRRLNMQFSLVEVLVSRQQVEVETVKRMFSILGRSMLRCLLCDVQYQIVDFDKEDEYKCPKCGAKLEPPVVLDPLMVDGVVRADEVERVGDAVSQPYNG